MAESGECEKAKKHLNLLRQEYLKLQNKYTDLEQKYNVLVASTGGGSVGSPGGNSSPGDNCDSFISKLLKVVGELFDRELYSDLTVEIEDRQVKAHKFVLAARSDAWCEQELQDVSILNYTELGYDVGMTLLKWVYTDKVELKQDDKFVLDLMSAASRFKLTRLMDRCEKMLMSSVAVNNCIRFYQTAENIGALSLRDYCSEIISNHWVEFSSDDFAIMSAPLLYKMFKTKSSNPLHAAIRNHREDVVFLYLIEYDSQLAVNLNSLDENGELPLDIALHTEQESIATTLVNHGANIDSRDQTGECLLHKALRRGDVFSAGFLLNQGCDVNLCTTSSQESALHIIACWTRTDDSYEQIINIARLLVEKNCNPNLQDSEKYTALHRCVEKFNDQLFNILLDTKRIDVELLNNENESALWLSLAHPNTPNYESEFSFANQLILYGANADALSPKTGDSLLHLAARCGNEKACLFLIQHCKTLNIINGNGESVLHVACAQNLCEVVSMLLASAFSPNCQTRLRDNVVENSTVDEDMHNSSSLTSQQTPLHIAIMNLHTPIVDILLKHREKAMTDQSNRLILPDLSLKDSLEQTPLAVAVWSCQHDIASKLLTAGSDVNYMTTDGMCMLHIAIMNQDNISALYLIANKADINIRTKDGETALQLAVKRHLPLVVEALCQNGGDMRVCDEQGNPPLWVALESGQEDIASVLVRYGCDTNYWATGPDKCQQTLLHKAIDENNEAVASFLIRSGCDVNSPRRLGLNGEGEDVVMEQHTPLHLASTWGLELVTQCLLEHNANVNSKDCEGKTAIHIAIANQHSVIISLLLSVPNLDLSMRDRHGQTPFACAMTFKNNKAAQAILDREPRAAEQVDNKGRNFLHLAVQNCDIESVLFLLSVNANVNSELQDSTKQTPLHISVLTGSEIIVRNLLLAGVNVNALTSRRESALHLASSKDHSVICGILLENGAEYDSVDTLGNNALHIGVYYSHIATVRVLLANSSINAQAFNNKGQTPLHTLAQFGRENAVTIFEVFRECIPDYPLDIVDSEGNTALLLGYLNGNGSLSRAIVRAGARLGMMNNQGVSIFTSQVATKQLLFRLLDMLSAEPAWCEGDYCLECSTKFGIKTRKHHCRHCGRLLCAKCSDKMMPILKYGIQKPVRVCDICFDVLTLGTN